jgi:hypothetical protein
MSKYYHVCNDLALLKLSEYCQFTDSIHAISLKIYVSTNVESSVDNETKKCIILSEVRNERISKD